MRAERIFEEIRNSKAFYGLIGLIVLAILSTITAPNFKIVGNIITVFRQASVLLVLSAGSTAVLLTGGMDLSVGTTAGFIGCTCTQYTENSVSIPTTFILGILTRLVVGVISGLLAGVLPNFITIYGTSWVVSGFVVLVMQGVVIYGLPKSFTWIGVGYTNSVPNLTITVAVVVALIYILPQKAIYGRQIYAYGSNPIAAKYMAVPAKKIILPAFMMYSIYTDLTSILMTARLNAADVATRDNYGLQTVVAVAVGGTSMLGGEGSVLEAVVEALVFTIVVNVMNLRGISSYAQGLVTGIVTIAAAPFDTCNEREQENEAI